MDSKGRNVIVCDNGTGVRDLFTYSPFNRIISAYKRSCVHCVGWRCCVFGLGLMQYCTIINNGIDDKNIAQ